MFQKTFNIRSSENHFVAVKSTLLLFLCNLLIYASTPFVLTREIFFLWGPHNVRWGWDPHAPSCFVNAGACTFCPLLSAFTLFPLRASLHAFFVFSSPQPHCEYSGPNLAEWGASETRIGCMLVFYWRGSKNSQFAVKNVKAKALTTIKLLKNRAFVFVRSVHCMALTICPLIILCLHSCPV